MSAIEWLIELTVGEGKAVETRALLEEMAVAIAASEPGTETWQWFLAEDGAGVAIVERYRDEAAAMTHLENFGRFAERFLAVLKPIEFKVLGQPSHTLRQAVAGFGPNFFASGGGFRR